MRKSNITATFKANVSTVWDVVTNNEKYSWRSDLSKIEILGDGNKFIEHTKDGFTTYFTVTTKQEYERYEFDLENNNMKGHWIGIFTTTEDGGTKIDFTEEINIKNPFMEILSYLFMNLKKIQETYIMDLKKELGEV